MQTVVIFSSLRKGQKYGLANDARLLELTFRELNMICKTNIKIIHKDPLSFISTGLPDMADVHIYLEVPCRAAFSWAKINVIIPTQEYWYSDAWSWVAKEPNVVFFFKTHYCQQVFEQRGIKGFYIGWRGLNGLMENVVEKKRQFLYIIGCSNYKKAAANIVVDAWLPDFPPLLLLGSEKGADKPGVQWITKYVSETDKKILLNESEFHIVASLAEGLGYTIMEAVGAGAQILWNNIPVYRERWAEIISDNGCIPITMTEDISGCCDKKYIFTKEDVVKTVRKLIQSVPVKTGPDSFTKITKEFRYAFFSAWKTVTKKMTKQIAMMKPVDNLPVLGVITLVHNRPEWFSHAVRNIEITNYPRDKFVWVVVDDSDPKLRVDFSVEKVRNAYSDLNIQYVSLVEKTPIGEKRNRGCAAALMTRQDLTCFAFMDDDDHYPPDSLRKRVTWLLGSKKEAVYCSTLPMYDICKYISAINVPPLYLAPCQRISEATLCFTKTFWKRKGFPKSVQIAEGEDFIHEREHETLEIPPVGIIVSFLHRKNLTSRRVPESKEPNGCHYGFSDEYFEMISKIGGALN